MTGDDELVENAPHELGGRNIVAFMELSELGSSYIESIYPIAEDGGEGLAFTNTNTGSVNVWGIESTRGQRIWEAYESGDLPTGDTEELNRILRSDEYDDE